MTVALLVAMLTGAVASAMGGPTGAIFTTVPDGSIVNENVHYNAKIEVYLDGGPPPNAPADAAGLDEGMYVFQITDPSGKVLLSEDPSMCRVVEVDESGLIVRLVDPSEVTAVPGILAGYEGKGKNAVALYDPCHIQDEPDGVAGPSGRHDTNTDVDHGELGAIVVQMMPFLDTPNPGGVYKAWMTPLTAYEAKNGDLEEVPTELTEGKGKNKVVVGFRPDPGFGPPRNILKTDNFKVREFSPAAITVRKFYDVDGDGVWDDGEPEIGVGSDCVTGGGALIDCASGGGGWPYAFTEPLANGDTVTTPEAFTPGSHVAGVQGTYTAVEAILAGWTQTALIIDGVPQAVSASASVNVLGAFGESHEIIFGNSLPDVTVDKTPNAGAVVAGDDATFTIVVTNNGPVTAYGVTLSDTLPTAGNGWTLGGDDAADCGIVGSLLTCDFGDLAVNETKSITVTTVTDPDQCDDGSFDLDNTAVIGAVNEPNTSNNSDDGSITVTCSDVTVDKTPDAGVVVAGDTATFDIVVTNSSLVNAYDVTLTDTLPIVNGGWSIDSDTSSTCAIALGVLDCGPVDLAPSGSFKVVISTVTDPDECVDGSFDLDNTAIVAASNEGDTSNNSNSGFISVVCSDVTVDKAPDAGVVVAGDTATFDIVVTNNSTVAAYDVTLTDTLPAANNGWSIDSDSTGTCDIVAGVLDCGPVDLAAGGSFSVSISTETDPEQCVGGSYDLDNTAIVAASNEDDTSNNSDDGMITVVCSDVTVDKTPDAGVVVAGDTATFAIVVTNNSTVAAYDVTLTDTLPAANNGWSIDSDSTGTCDIVAGVLDCGPVDLAAGGSFNVSISTETDPDQCVDGSYDLDNTAIVAASNEDDTSNNSDDGMITVNCPDIVVTKTAGDAELVGGDIVFTIVVSNDGPGEAAGVTLTDDLPGTGWSIDSDTTGTCDITDGTLDCGPVALASGASFTVVISRATGLDDCGGVHNVVSVSATNEADGNTGNNSDDATAPVVCPACGGLTPGFWKNWSNHYSIPEFELLIVGTIAPTIAEVDAIFDEYNASDPSDLTILKAFILANQLTVALTAYNFDNDPDLFNSSNGSLYGACELGGGEGSLGDTLTIALDILADKDSYTDAEILAIKDILDAFANFNNAS